MVIVRQDTNGVKPLLQTGELGYDNFPAGGDEGRVYVGTGNENVPLAKKEEVDEIIEWLTGYDHNALNTVIDQEINFEEFFNQAPKLNPSRSLIKGVICGVRLEEIEDDLMREIRYLDKLIDELARGKSMDKILRKS